MLAPVLALLVTAAPALELAPPAARPGDAVLVRVTGSAAEPRGTLGDRRLRFWAAGAEEWWALAALPIEAAPGSAPARVAAGGSSLAAELTVVEPGFASHALTLDRKYVEPPKSVQKRMAADRRAFAEAFSQPFGPPLFREGFGWPRRAPTSGRYGDQRVLNGKKPTVHYGLDVTGPRGAPIAAANDGVVVIARDAYLSGNTVVLWHGAGVYTAYFHLDRISVQAGQRVARGEPIGQLGATGRATGPHLHWGVKVDGLYVDPTSLLAIDLVAGSAPPRPTGPVPIEPPAAEEAVGTATP